MNTLVTVKTYQRKLEIKIDGFEDKQRFVEIYAKQLRSRGYEVDSCYLYEKDHDILISHVSHEDGDRLGDELSDCLDYVYLAACKEWSGT